MQQLKQLHDLGFALHWLRPNSKIPVESGWSKGDRLAWDTFISKYGVKNNVGVRLGHASKIGSKFLAVIDMDVKGDDFEDEENALEALYSHYPDAQFAPSVLSGRGNGSRHFYILLDRPHRGDLKIESEKRSKVFMPSVQPSGKDRQALSAEEIAAGYRSRPAWEVSLMSEGRQVALPPSIHPDTLKPYEWERSLLDGLKMPTIVPKLPAHGALKGSEGVSAPPKSQGLKTYAFREVDVFSLGLYDEQIYKITEGLDVDDRSATCLSIAMALVNREVDDETIISILTDRSFFLGNCAFDHAKTTDRNRAAYWIERYILAKAKKIIAEDKAAQYAIFEVESGGENDANETPEWIKKLDYTKEKKLKATWNNVVLILENIVGQNLVARNLFTHDDVFKVDTPFDIQAGKKRSGNSDDALKIKEWFANKYRVDVGVSMINEALDRIALKNGFHPVKDFLESLEWDGVPRIDTALKTYLGATAPEPYLSQASRKFFLALVHRIYRAGCKFDHLPVLEGKQGKGKSTFGAILVGQDWYMDGLPDLHDKDAALNIQGIWLCEMSELASLYRSKLEVAKGFISRRVDKLRPPYGHRRQDFPRSTVFLGTTNDSEYLKDPTGNRRYWPIPIHSLDFEGLERDRLQLFAEAKFAFDFDSEQLWLQGEAVKQSEGLHAERLEDDGYDDLVEQFEKFIDQRIADNADTDSFSMRELFDECFITLQDDEKSRRKMSRLMREKGFDRNHTMKGKRWVRT